MNGLELKPCPFCGGEAVINPVFDLHVYFVHCKNCDCAIGRFYRDKCDAIEAWNRRVNDENAG